MGANNGKEEYKNYVFPKADIQEIKEILETKVGPNSPISLTKIVNITRAFLEKPPILFLEESALSFEIIEGSFYYNLFWSYLKDTTIISLLSDFDNILKYDRVFIFDNGKIIESGPPKELLKASGSKLTEYI